MANISWISTTSGDWYDAANWSTATVPGEADDVTIAPFSEEVTGEIVISFSQGNPEYNSLSLFAANGGVLNLPGLTSYVGSDDRGTSIQASESGSRIDLSNVGTLTGSTGFLDRVNISALAGGEIDLSGLTSISGGVTELLASGSSSVIELPSLTSFVSGELRVTNGGTLNTDNLSSIDLVSLVKDGSGTIETNRLTNIDSSSIFALNGATIAFPNVTSYGGDDQSSTSSTLEANGEGSTIDLSNVGTLTGATGFLESVNIRALAGGELDLSGLTSISGGVTELLASGSSSVIELPSLTSFVSGELRVTNGGTLNTDNLSRMDLVSLIKDGSGTIETNQLTNIDRSSIFALNGATIALPNVTSYAGDDQSSTSSTLEANGEGSTIDLSNVDTLTGATGFLESVNIRALAGGKLDLSRLTNISGGMTELLANGASSLVELPSLTSFVSGELRVTNGGTLNTDNLTSMNFVSLVKDGSGTIETSQLTNIDRSSIFALNGATIALPSVTSYGGDQEFSTSSTLEANGEGSRIDLSNVGTLTGATGFLEEVNIRALAGGELDLSGLTSIPSGATAFLANGASSVVELPRLTSLASGELRVTNDGTLNTDDLSSIDFVSLVKDGSGTIKTSQLTNIDRSNIFALNGATIAFPNVTSYAGDDQSSTSSTLEANGDGSRIDLSNVGTLTGATGFLEEVNIRALAGGELDLSGLTSIPSGVTEALADGERSWLSLSSLTNFPGENLERNGGVIVLRDDGTIIPTISIAPNTEPREEGVTRGTYTVNLTNPAPDGGITIGYDVSGTATLFRDHSLSAGSGDVTLEDTFFILREGQTTGTINVVPVDDRFSDPDETVQLIFGPSSRYNLSSNDSAVVTIEDNDADGPPDITVNIAPGATPREEGPTNGTYIITLSDPVSNEGLILDYRVTGSATRDADYSLSAGAGVTNITGNQITLAEGSTTATVNLIPITDAITDPEETVRLAITGSPRYQVGSNNSATLSITDSEGGIEPPPPPPSDDINLDIDGNGETDALTDGIAAIRYLFRFSGDVLINNVIGEGATRTTALEITNYLDLAQETMLDVDGNGMADALTDGLMIVRYLFGFGGNAVIDGAIGPNATRSTADAIIAHLESFDL